MNWLIRHVMCALYPRTAELPGIVDTDLDGFLKRYRAEAPWLMWLGVVLGSVLFAVMPLFTVFVPLPSFLLPRRLLDKHAMRVTQTGVYLIRQGIFVVKLAAGMCWGQDPAVRACMHMEPYPPDPGTVRSGEA